MLDNQEKTRAAVFHSDAYASLFSPPPPPPPDPPPPPPPPPEAPTALDPLFTDYSILSQRWAVKWEVKYSAAAVSGMESFGIDNATFASPPGTNTIECSGWSSPSTNITLKMQLTGFIAGSQGYQHSFEFQAMVPPVPSRTDPWEQRFIRLNKTEVQGAGPVAALLPGLVGHTFSLPEEQLRRGPGRGVIIQHDVAFPEMFLPLQ